MHDSNQALPSGIGREIERFVSAVDSLRATIDSTMGVVQKAHDLAHKQFDSYIAKYADISMKDGKQFVTMRSHDHCHGYRSLRLELDKLHAAQRILPRSFLLALVSRYDALVGSLVRALFVQKPEALRSSDKSFTFAELSQFQSLEDVRESIVEREVESLLRKSHSDQFEWLEKRFDIKLRQGLSAWSAFTEITERRNLFAHAEGIVSSQYIAKCRAEGVDLDDAIKGAVLYVDGPYFDSASDIICEIGVKLAQVLWRKLVSREVEEADASLRDTALDAIEHGRYELAKALLDFANTTLAKRHGSEEWRLIFVINQALAHSLSGDKVRCKEILASEDWSATDDTFKLSESVLTERFDVAFGLMKRIGPNGDIPKGHYLHWPLFSGLRRSPIFAKTIAEIFGDETHEEELPAEGPNESA